MADWKAYPLADAQGNLYLADPTDVLGARETMDGHSVILFRNGAEVSVRLPAKTVMADVVPAPQPPLFVAKPDGQRATFTGSADPGSIVNVRDGAQLVATVQADGTGNWTTVPVDLAPGNNSLTATQIDLFGRESQPSPTCSLNIEAPPPPPPPPEPSPEQPATETATDQDGPVEIPEDWADQHHSTRIALAKKLAPDATVDTAAQADEIIAAEAERRAAPQE